MYRAGVFPPCLFGYNHPAGLQGVQPLEMAVSSMPICLPWPPSPPNPQISREADEVLLLHYRAQIAPTPFGMVSPACLRDVLDVL